jgi:hypothetical protein
VVAITGVHALLYSSRAEEVRVLLRDVFGWSHVNAGDGWLIFKLPPAELGVHPADGAHHELSLMCDDIEATLAELGARGIEVVSGVENMGFGLGATIRLPGELDLLVYQPRHPTAL